MLRITSKALFFCLSHYLFVFSSQMTGFVNTSNLARSETYGNSRNCISRVDPRRARRHPQACDGHVRQLQPGIRLSAAGMPLLHARQMLDRCILPVFSRCGTPAEFRFGGQADGQRQYNLAKDLPRLRDSVYPGHKSGILFGDLPYEGKTRSRPPPSAAAQAKQQG